MLKQIVASFLIAFYNRNKFESGHKYSSQGVDLAYLQTGISGVLFLGFEFPKSVFFLGTCHRCCIFFGSLNKCRIFLGC